MTVDFSPLSVEGTMSVAIRFRRLVDLLKAWMAGEILGRWRRSLEVLSWLKQPLKLSSPLLVVIVRKLFR